MNDIYIMIICFIFSALFSGLETGCYSLNRIRLRRRILEQNKQARRVQGFLSRPYRFMFTVLIGNNLAIYFLSSQMTNIYIQKGLDSNKLILGSIPLNAELLATLTLVFPIFIFCEILPKHYFRIWADKLMYFFSFIIKIIITGFAPLTWPIEFLYALLRNNYKNKSTDITYEVSSDVLKNELIDGKNDGVITTYQSQMIDHVMTMNKTKIKKLMKPIKRTQVLNKSARINDCIKILKGGIHNKIFIGNYNQFLGIISNKNLILSMIDTNKKAFPLAENILKFNMDTSIKYALNQFKISKSNYAIISNKYGYIEGYVSKEDIAKYIAQF